MKKILIATNNKGKVKEIKEILNDYELLTLDEVNGNINVVEDGETFEENSEKKAIEIGKKTGLPTISDDSGLCIEILDNWPGVHTARFLGKDATDRQRNEAILAKMKNCKNRNAKVVCAISYYENGKVSTVKGEIQGKITDQLRGKNGFGFDEIFELESGKTLAELSSNEKNKISSRRIALQKLKEIID